MRKLIPAFFTTALLIIGLPLLSSARLSPGSMPLGFKYVPAAALPVMRMPAINVDSMLAEDAANDQLKGHPYRFGYNHLVYYKTDNSGTWTNLPNGDRIWQLDVKTPGSYSINLGFNNFHLPEGASLFVYTKDQAQILKYTSANNTPDNFLGTDLIKGDEAVVEYYEPAAARGQSNFILFRITQGYKDINHYLKSGSGFGAAGTCIHNVNCPQYYDYATQKRAVVCIVINGGEFCSGTLLNNVLNDGTPYILTANHCVTGAVDGTWIFRFNWEAPGCEEPGSSPSYEIVTGASLVAKSGVSDFALVKMDTTPPPSYHAFYAGWNRGLAAATSVTDIHHPSGDIKKCSQANNPVTDTVYNAGNGFAQVWQIGLWTDGATEPGSSGSPLFDQNKRVIGQLYGGPSDCGEAANQLRDYFGRFPVSWDSGSTPQTRLKDWLDPNNSGAITNDGYDPNPLIVSNDIELYNVLVPSANTCNTSITPSITVNNLGTQAVSSILVNYYIYGGSGNTFTWTGTLNAGSTTVINLPALATVPGTHTFYANVNLPAGTTDSNLYNDSISSIFVVYDSGAAAWPLAQGFEGSFPPPNWEITPTPSGTTWARSNYGGFGTSSHSLVVNEFSPPNSTIGETPRLYSAPVNMAGAPGPSFIKFDVAYAAYNALQNDSLAILVTTDCGATWTKIYQKGGDTLATSTYADSLFTPTSTQWRKDSVDISNLIGQTEVLFQFELISGYGNATYLDNIDIADSLNSTLDILPVNGEMQVHVFPNPFTQNLTLQFSLDATKIITAGVYAVDGKKLISIMDNEKTDAGMHQLDINTNGLSNGIYILKVNERFFKLEKLK